MLNPLAPVFSFGETLIDKLFPDKGEAERAKNKLREMQQTGELETMKVGAGIITAEAKSDSWLASNWRPLTMLVFVAIIANNYLLYPYLSLFWDEAPKLEVPPNMWDLLKLGLGGYVVGRSAEKVAKAIKGK